MISSVRSLKAFDTFRSSTASLQDRPVCESPESPLGPSPIPAFETQQVHPEEPCPGSSLRCLLEENSRAGCAARHDVLVELLDAEQLLGARSHFLEWKAVPGRE